MTTPKRKVRCPVCKCLCTIEGEATFYYQPVNKKRIPKNGKEAFGKACIICGAIKNTIRRRYK